MSAKLMPLSDLPTWPRFLLKTEACAYLRITETSFLTEVNLGLWPKPVKRVGAQARWDRAALDQASEDLPAKMALLTASKTRSSRLTEHAQGAEHEKPLTLMEKAANFGKG
ncbi:hypothetical protein [Kiloniella sp.]|uniref:hypothetical protein n=1 Tax=Kiloniella sp. TaxID=1938587 RepID=UPI003B0110AB